MQRNYWGAAALMLAHDDAIEPQSNLFCPCERSEIGEVPQGEGVKTVEPLLQGVEPRRSWLVPR